MTDEFQIMEAKDEDQILAELQGSFLKKFVYSFKVGGRPVTGISWAGIKEIAYRLKGIDTEIQKFEETETHYIFIVKATNKDVGSRLGVSNQPKMNGAKVDQFALQKALSKAQRNAIRGVIPEATIEMYLTEFGNVPKNVDRFNPPATIREVKAEVIKESEHGQNMPWDGDLSPANMQAYLTANGFDGPKFRFRDDESGMVVCDSAPWTDDFDVLQKVYREMGGEYVKEHNKWVFRH
jgi:hypothetical protein